MSRFSDWFHRFFFGTPALRGEERKEPKPEPPTELTQSPAFLRALAYTFKNEGGFSNDPADHGGATNFGITRGTLSRWRGYTVSAREVEKMPRSEAESIYHAYYWKPLSLDRIAHEKVAMALFDRAVLNGLTGVSRHVRNVYPGIQDGDLPNFNPLIPLINNEDPRTFVLKLADYCEKAHRDRVKNDRSQEVFLKGWLNRVERQRRELT